MKKRWRKRIYQAGLIGLAGGIITFTFIVMAFVFCEETLKQGIAGYGLRTFVNVPLAFFSFCVSRGIFSEHNAIAAIIFVGVWCFLVSFVLGVIISFSLEVIKQKRMS